VRLAFGGIERGGMDGIGHSANCPLLGLRREQSQSGDGRSAQTGAADLQNADLGRGIHRSRAGLLRRTLRAARAAQPQPAGAAVGNNAGAGRARRAGRLKSPRESVTW
jgi:hypothetical protein